MDAPGEPQPPPPEVPEVPSLHSPGPPDVPPLNTAAAVDDAFAPPEQLTLDLPPLAPPPFTRAPADTTSAASRDHSPDNSEGRVHDDESEGPEDDDDSESEDEMASRKWYPIEEDKSEPCEDEMAYISSREEHSARDQEHWQKLAFFDTNDPELTAMESGVIDWTIDRFNGTKENPNTDRIMRSPVVRIGGYEWRIKFYPHGHHTDYMSVFIENATMQSPEFTGTEEFQELPFPVMRGMQPDLKKRSSCAAQICVVMYNPDEPRTNEHQTEAHQFHKGSADYGWKYFNRYPRYEFHLRQHTQRQAMLRGDKLAFRAYIRIVNDPTGCLWEHGKHDADDTEKMTGLRPFTKSLPYIAGIVPLMHFRPFRALIKGMHKPSNLRSPLQTILLKMYSRKRSAQHNNPPTTTFRHDAMEMLWRFNVGVHRDFPQSAEADRFKELVGTFHSDKGSATGANRLNTTDFPSIQAAVDKHPKTLACPQILTLELQRQEHDKSTRKWKKLVNNVEVSDALVVNGIQYTLYAFITHSGHLQSYNYTPYVRPRGPGKGWYAYHEGRVTIMTEKQAREKHSGPSNDTQPTTGEATFNDTHLPLEEVPCIVMYVRNDVAADTFDSPDEEFWFPPTYRQIRNEYMENQPDTAVHESFVLQGECDLRGAPVSEEDHERIAALADAAEQATPAPELMDSEDVVMRDADDDSEIYVEEPKLDPSLTDLATGINDWLGGDYYEGHYNRQTRYHGGGHLISQNGDEYLGSFKNGVKSGFGKMIFAQTGDVYEGDWDNGMMHGKGKLVEKSSGNIYSGNFKEGRKHGEFILTGQVTEDDKDLCNICWTNELNCAFYDCGHIVNCFDCAQRIKECPVCRRRVLHRLRIYGVRVSMS